MVVTSEEPQGDDICVCFDVTKMRIRVMLLACKVPKQNVMTRHQLGILAIYQLDRQVFIISQLSKTTLTLAGTKFHYFHEI